VFELSLDRCLISGKCSQQVACQVVCQGDFRPGNYLGDKLLRTEEEGLCFDEEIAKTHVSLVFPKVLRK